MPDPAQPRRVYLLLAKLLIILSITSHVGALFLPGFEIPKKLPNGLTAYPPSQVISPGFAILIAGWLQIALSVFNTNYLGALSWFANWTLYLSWWLYNTSRYRSAALCAVATIVIGHICLLLPYTISSWSWSKGGGEFTPLTRFMAGYYLWTWSFYLALAAPPVALLANWLARQSKQVALRQFD